MEKHQDTDIEVVADETMEASVEEKKDTRRGFIDRLGKACAVFALGSVAARCGGDSKNTPADVLGDAVGADMLGDVIAEDGMGEDGMGEDGMGEDGIGEDGMMEDIVYETTFDNVLVGEIEDGVGLDYSPTTGKERKAIPSACWQCVSRDGMIAHVEDGRLEHIEGNPKLRKSGKSLCAKGQGGVGQVYDPDRLLFPMRRKAGTARGDHQWERITWDDALEELAGKMQTVRDNSPKQLMLHYGRMKASSSKIMKDYFLYGFGTKSYAGHTAICEAAKWTAQELVWGKHYDVNDLENTSFVLNFGCNPMESHTSHLPIYKRMISAVQDGNVPLYTFDVRLSNTAARSTEWLPIKAGTDLAVVLAMANYILSNDLAPQAGKDFINTWTNLDANGFDDRVAKLASVLQNPKDYINDSREADPDLVAYWDAGDQPEGGYTADWAEGISGVPAAKIEELAAAFAAASPGATVLSYRGAVAHFNGVVTEIAIQMLEGICGNIDVPGGRVHGVGASWNYSKTYPKNSSSGLSGLKVQNDGAYVLPTHHASHQVLEEVKKAAPEDRPEIYLVYCYTPAYANGDIQGNIDILKDESVLPYIVCCDVAYSEAAMYADLVLPDTTYLERWDWEDMVSYNMIHEYYIRQPVVEPLGEVRDMKETAMALAAMLSTGADDGLQKLANIETMENYVKAACIDTDVVNNAGKAAGYADGFEFMKAEGAWWDPEEEPNYMAYAAPKTLEITDPETIADDDEEKYTFCDDEGICWEATKAQFNDGYRKTKSSYSKYKGQKIGDDYFAGFKPDKANKSGMFELDSPLLKAKHYPGMPLWMPIPEHQNMANDELVLTSYKISTQIHSRSQNCKYLTEVTHDNPAWLNTKTAAALGIANGDMITLTRSGKLFNSSDMDEAKAMGTTVNEIEVEVRVTEAIHPKAIAISHHLGHWAYGRYASGNKNPMLDDPDQTAHSDAEVDNENIWWKKFGYRGNWIVPNAGDPICGAHRIFDTVVKVKKA
jgi:thiosulfate reductase / polysulfide reductase chain A